MLQFLIFGRNHVARSMCLGIGLLLGAGSQLSIADEPTPIGLWKTVDDKTGKAKGLVRIYEQKGRLFGKVEKSLDPANARERCAKCTGDRKDKPMVGLVVLENMEKRGSEFSGGEFLDPENGSVYKCKFKLLDQGKKLELRGYLGFSLFGRNQTWIREQ